MGQSSLTADTDFDGQEKPLNLITHLPLQGSSYSPQECPSPFPRVEANNLRETCKENSSFYTTTIYDNATELQSYERVCPVSILT